MRQAARSETTYSGPIALGHYRMPAAYSKDRRSLLLAFGCCAACMAASAAPDLIVQDIWSSPDPLVLSQSYSLYARVLNQGDTTASAGILQSQRVDFSLDGNIIGSAYYDDVPPGGYVVISISTYAPSLGTHQFRATADADDRIAESNEANNARTETWNISATDLVVQCLSIVPNPPTNGQICTVLVCIQNKGATAASAFTVGIYRGGVFINEFPVPGLAPGMTFNILWQLGFPSAGTFQVCAKADNRNQIIETDEGNNQSCTIVNVMPGPILGISPGSLNFGYAPTEQTLNLWNSGGDVLGYSVDANRPWIGVFPGGGTCGAGETNLIIVSIDVSGLLIGTHTATVTVASTAGTSNITVTVNILDGDGDQVPDGWETQYFGSPANCNPFLDPDNDTQNNRQEWIGGSNPTNKLSAFAIASAELSPGSSNIVIHWPTLPGRLYDVLWSTNANGPFLPLGSNLPNTQTNYSDTTAPAGGFYRVDARTE